MAPKIIVITVVSTQPIRFLHLPHTVRLYAYLSDELFYYFFIHSLHQLRPRFYCSVTVRPHTRQRPSVAPAGPYKRRQLIKHDTRQKAESLPTLPAQEDPTSYRLYDHWTRISAVGGRFRFVFFFFRLAAWYRGLKRVHRPGRGHSKWTQRDHQKRKFYERLLISPSNDQMHGWLPKIQRFENKNKKNP